MSVSLTKIQMEDGTAMYVEYEEIKDDKLRAASIRRKIDSKQRLEMMRNVTSSTLSVFKNSVVDQIKNEVIEGVKPKSISLDIGLQFGGEMGVPFVTKGSAQANLKVSIIWEMKED